MSPDNITEDTRCKEAIFTALAGKFELNDKVKKLFLEGPMENLEDFRYYFADEKEIDTLIWNHGRPCSDAADIQNKKGMGSSQTSRDSQRQHLLHRKFAKEVRKERIREPGSR